MSLGVNKTILLGNLGADPELRYTQTGQAVINIRLVTNELVPAKDGEKKEIATWHSVVAWGKLAEILAKSLEKGSRIYVEGRISNSTYNDKEGNKRYKSEVTAREVVFLSARGEKDQLVEEKAAPEETRHTTIDADDIPF